MLFHNSRRKTGTIRIDTSKGGSRRSEKIIKSYSRVGDIPEAMINTIPIQYHRILFILATIQYLILLVPNTGLPKQYYHGSPPPFDNSGPARIERLRESQRGLWSFNLTF